MYVVYHRIHQRLKDTAYGQILLAVKKCPDYVDKPCRVSTISSSFAFFVRVLRSLRIIFRTFWERKSLPRLTCQTERDRIGAPCITPKSTTYLCTPTLATVKLYKNKLYDLTDVNFVDFVRGS